MKARDRGLLGDIERGALDENVSLASLLRKCIALGGHAGSTELRDWALRELKGYGAGDELPEYRTVGAPLAVDGIRGNYMNKDVTISPYDLPDFVRESGIGETVDLRMGVKSIEDLANRSDEVRLSLPDGASIAKLMTAQAGDPYQVIHRVYWIVSPVAFREVIDHIRTALTQLVAELAAAMSDGQQVPTKEVADMATHFAVTGNRKTTINIVNSQATAGGTSTVSPQPSAPSESFWRRWRKRGIFVGIATVVAGLTGIATWLDWTPW